MKHLFRFLRKVIAAGPLSVWVILVLLQLSMLLEGDSLTLPLPMLHTMGFAHTDNEIVSRLLGVLGFGEEHNRTGQLIAALIGIVAIKEVANYTCARNSSVFIAGYVAALRIPLLDSPTQARSTFLLKRRTSDLQQAVTQLAGALNV